MKLIIGGYAQGKLRYAMEKYGLDESRIWDGEVPQTGGKEKAAEDLNGPMAINHFHSWVKSSLIKGGCPEEEIRIFLEKYPDCVIISDEIGNGIVPVEAFEREYRERTGRILTELAGRADEVVRVICGIGRKIK